MNRIQNDTEQSIEAKIKKIYEELLPPTPFRSNIEFYDEQNEMKRDCKSYHFSDYSIVNIQIELELDKQRTAYEKNKNKDNNQAAIYHFNIKNKLPKSQLMEYTAYIKSQFGCKILKTKASQTKMELHLEPNSVKNKKDPIYVFLGQVSGKFKIRISNYVLLEDEN